VSLFRYLDSLISEERYCTKDIWSKIEMAKTNVYKEKGIVYMDVDVDKQRILEAFEMRIWRRM